jgi:hypothetical protein
MSIDHIPDDWGHWFAGFVDGEGSFNIVGSWSSDKPDRVSYRCQLDIAIRDDDSAILEEIAGYIGGRVSHERRGTNDPETHHDRAKWVCSGWWRNFHVLIPLLRRCPLRAKKKRDLDVYASAVAFGYNLSVKTTAGPRKIRWTHEARDRIRRFKLELETGRKYDPENFPLPGPDPQARLF